MTIKIGDKVQVLPKCLGSLGMPHRYIQGGKGKITEIGEDKHGTVYRVYLKRSNKVRVLRRDMFVTHRKNRS